MKTSELFILIGGTLSLLIVVFHCFFYRLFSWKAEFRRIQLINYRIFFTIHLALILLFVIFCLLSFLYFRELAACNGIAFGLVIGYAVFWLWRTIWQIVYFKQPKGTRKRPGLHYGLIMVFGLLFVFYAFPVLIKLIN